MSQNVVDTNSTKDVYDDDNVIKHMIETYTTAEDSDEARASVVEFLANELGKSAHSIRGKLRALGVYKPKVVAKARVKETKDTLADRIAGALETEYGIVLSEGETESLTKTNKTVLVKLIDALETTIDFESETSEKAQ